MYNFEFPVNCLKNTKQVPYQVQDDSCKLFVITFIFKLIIIFYYFLMYEDPFKFLNNNTGIENYNIQNACNYFLIS